MASLGISPSHPARARPTPPGRSKRVSLTPTLRTNIPPAPPSPGAAKRGMKGGVMGGLRERSEEEVRRAGREELVLALKGEWETRDRINEHVDALEGERRRLEMEREELMQSLGGLQARVDDAFNEQSRLEADLEGRDELLDKMRGRISDGEKAVRDGQKRYTEQERSFEAEREAFRAQELQLQTRIKTLSSTPSNPGKNASPTRNRNESMELLQEELASLSASHCTLIAQLNTVSTELGSLRERNKTLEEENAGWELLMRERTLNGGMRGKGLLGEDWLDEGEESDGEDEGMGGRTELEALDEEMEGFMSISPVVTKFASVRSNKQRKGKGGSLGDSQFTGSGGLDLAAELGRAEVDTDAGEMRVLGKGDEGEALRAEVKQLREQNKALSLYCSKIIDRIIAQEGFEHVLAVEYKTRRLHTQRSKATGATRTSVHDIVSNMQQGGGSGEVPPPVPAFPTSLAPAKEVEAKPVVVKKARPMSMMARTFSTTFSSAPAVIEESGSEDAARPVVVPTVSKVVTDEEAKAAKKAKRGFSIDFRNFGFGSAPAAVVVPPPEPKGLKPLQLPRRTASQSRPTSVRNMSPPMLSPIDHSSLHSVHAARKLDPQAEDEEDRRERHRMEAAMRLMGIDRSSLSPSGTIAEETEPDMNRMAKPRTSTGSESTSSSTSSRTTPLSRLSSRLAPITLSPSLELIDPMSPITDDPAIQVFVAFDKKEQEQSRLISKDKTYQAGFTCPSSPPSTIGRDRRKSLRRGSAQSSDGALKAIGRGRISKSESISTLWSAGSGSRRGSVVDVVSPEEAGLA